MGTEPMPQFTMVDTIASRDGEPVTLITRIWFQDDADRCERCPACNAIGLKDAMAALCTVAIRGFIGDEDAATHRFDSDAGDEMPRNTLRDVRGAVADEDPGTDA